MLMAFFLRCELLGARWGGRKPLFKKEKSFLFTVAAADIAAAEAAEEIAAETTNIRAAGARIGCVCFLT